VDIGTIVSEAEGQLLYQASWSNGTVLWVGCVGGTRN